MDQQLGHADEAQFGDVVKTAVTQVNLQAPLPPQLPQYSPWDELNSNKPKKRNKIFQFIVYFSTGFFSLLLFLYLTFPYAVVKEVITTQLMAALRQSNLPLRISIGQLKPYWFTGVELTNIVVSNPLEPQVTLKLGQVHARLNVLPLLWGRVSANVFASQAGGFVDVDTSIPVTRLIQGNPVPKSIEVNLKTFPLDPLFAHIFAIAKSSREPSMVLMLPLISKTSAGGQVSGRITADVSDASNPGGALAKVALNIPGMFVHIDDDTLKIPRQNFEKAKILVTLKDGRVQIDEGTAFKSTDFGLEIKGSVQTFEPGRPPEALLNLNLFMQEAVERNIGFIIRTALSCSSKKPEKGVLTAQLTGPLSSMRCE